GDVTQALSLFLTQMHLIFLVGVPHSLFESFIYPHFKPRCATTVRKAVSRNHWQKLPSRKNHVIAQLGNWGNWVGVNSILGEDHTLLPCKNSPRYTTVLALET
ncbi:MAG: hypothetical protein ACFE0J_04775, partial [Elainellaceae cyanobacterium]